MIFSFFIIKLCEIHIFYFHFQIIFYQININYILILLFSFSKPTNKQTARV